MATKVQEKAGVAFGPKLGFASTKKVDFSVTDDKKSFEIRFRTALSAGVGTPSFDGLKKTRAPVSTNVFSAVVPASGKNVRTSIVVNGFGVTEPGTNTAVVITANGQHSVTHFTDTDEAFTASLAFRAKALTDVRVTVVLVAEREAAHPGASALIAVTDISADTALTRKKPAKRAPGKVAKKSR
jgi:hypothetical protein